MAANIKNLLFSLLRTPEVDMINELTIKTKRQGHLPLTDLAIPEKHFQRQRMLFAVGHFP